MQVFEKIIEKLEEKVQINERFGYMTASDVTRECIDIVKEVAEEYNNGWIPVSERLPEERDSVFAKYKGTARWTDAMFEKASDIVNVTVVDAKGEGVTTNAHTVDGQWKCDLLKFSNSFRITHWQPLPEPYQPKGEQE